MKGFFDEFKKFASRGSFIDLAVGIVIGTSFTAVTNSLVNNVITPPIGLVIGRVNFSDLTIPLGGKAAIQYGLFIESLITFLITALVLFMFVRFINKLQDAANKKKQEDAAAPAPAAEDSPEVSVLKEIRDTLKAHK